MDLNESNRHYFHDIKFKILYKTYIFRNFIERSLKLSDIWHGL